MSADKFNCPKCGNAATVTNTVVTQRNMSLMFDEFRHG
jgi:predicted nucleic-acid-binding Zn-ribbon protein